MKAFDVLVDSDALIALISEHDVHHARAQAIFERCRHDPIRLLTTELVIAETTSMLSRRLSYALACQFIHFVRRTGLPVIFLTADLQEQAYTVFLNEQRERTTAVDCANIVVAHHYGIGSLFSFDGIYTRHNLHLVT